MITAKEDSFEEVDQGVIGKIEWLIWHSSLSDQDKAKQMKRMLNLESTDDALRMVKFLEDFQPIVGVHRAPMTQYESVEATRRRVERDDFNERKK